MKSRLNLSAAPAQTLAQAIALSLALLVPVNASPSSYRQTEPPAADAKAIVAAAVKTELDSDRTDHSAYMYRDRDVTPDHDTLYYIIETPKGNLKKKLEDHGLPLTPDERMADDARNQKLLSDPGLQAKEQRDNAHDDEQAEQMLKLLPAGLSLDRPPANRAT